MKQLVLCMGSACFARGNDKMLTRVQGFILEHSCEALEVKGELCCEYCSGGPNIYLDGTEVLVSNPDQLIDYIQERL
ncbi:MAG: hypothetical protein OCC49_15785 [Fibrobacterales bacterium]